MSRAQYLPAALARQVYELDAEAASDAIDALVTQQTRAVHEKLHSRREADVAAVCAALSVTPLLSLISSSPALFEVAIRRLRAAYERTGDACVAQLLLHLAQQATAKPSQGSDKVH